MPSQNITALRHESPTEEGALQCVRLEGHAKPDFLTSTGIKINIHENGLADTESILSPPSREPSEQKGCRDSQDHANPDRQIPNQDFPGEVSIHSEPQNPISGRGLPSTTSTISRATRDDEEMAASALVSMYDEGHHEDDASEHDGRDMSRRKRPRLDSPSTSLKKISPSKNKTITSMCYECGTEQTSHFRPVVSDFIGKKSKTSESYPRVEVCNKCYCKMAPKLAEYPAWRLGMLKKQIGLYAEHGVTHFDVSREEVSTRKTEHETISFLGSLQMLTRAGGTVGALKVRPVLDAK